LTPEHARTWSHEDSPPFADPVADALAEALEGVVTDRPWAILLFGSRLVGTAPGPHSAYDLVLVVDAYAPFYRQLRASGRHGRSPRLLTALAGVLPPNVMSFDPGLPGGEIAKVMVFTYEHLERALSARPRDHFLLGRLVQKTRILRARDAEARQRLEALLAQARRGVLHWAAPWLPEHFSAGTLARTMVEVSYAGEVRPESAGRAAAVFEAQRDFLEGAYRDVLEAAERDGEVVRVPRPNDGAAADAWRLTSPPGAREKMRWRRYFRVSKVRATTRWLKHVATFDDWLTYIQRKVERRTGMQVEVTPLERRLPLLLLWPKVFRVLGALRRARREPLG